MARAERLVPLALALTCPDPIMRKTESCVITRQKVAERTIRLAERARLAFQNVDMVTSKGIETVYLASSGFALVAKLKADEEGECALAFRQTEVDRVPRGVLAQLPTRFPSSAPDVRHDLGTAGHPKLLDLGGERPDTF